MPTFDFSKINLARFAGTFFSGYAKRYGENWYDRLNELPFFRKFQAQHPVLRHGIESALYALTGLLDQTVGEDTFFKKLFKEVGMDFGSEFSKRLINGSQVKELLIRNPGHWETREEKELINILCDMPDKDLAAFLQWANMTTAKDRKKDIANLRKLTVNQIIEQSKNPELFKELLQYFRGPMKRSVVKDINAALRKSNKELEARIKARREGRMS